MNKSNKSILGRLGRVSAAEVGSMQPQRMTKPSDSPTEQSVPALSTDIRARTEMYTYFTEAGATKLLFAANNWVKMRLILENAGPVAIGTKQVITPVLSGKGILLPPTGEEIKFTLPRGDRLFIAAESINRVKVIIEPIAWQEQLLMATKSAAAALQNMAKSFQLFRRGR